MYPTLVHAPSRSGGEPLPSFTIWMQFSSLGYGADRDLTLEVLSTDIPEDSWLAYELESGGPESLIGGNWATVESGEGWVFGLSQMSLAIRLGLAPHQPFAVRVSVSYSTSYEGEHDVAFDWDVVARSPLEEAAAARRWNRWVRRFERYRSRAVEEMKVLRETRLQDTAAMYISRDVYWPGAYLDGMGRTGVLYKLCSRHTRLKVSGKFAHAEILSVRRDDGNDELARQELFEQIRAAIPSLEPESLPRR